MTFHGLLTALVTPFRNGALDEGAFRALVQRQIEGGVEGLVPCGTTGEAPTLPIPEHIQVVRWAVEEADGRVPVLAGIGSNSTTTAINTGKAVLDLGVDGVLVTAPYYNKPTQEGLYQHFMAVADALATEICLYDVPGRTAVHVEPSTVARLAEHERITAIKDATGDMANATEIRRLCGDRLALLSGDDFTTLAFLALGGSGTISVASNVVPEAMKRLVVAGREGRLAEGRAQNDRLFPLFRALFVESNPIPVKAALASMGLCENELRLPMCPIGDPARLILERELKALGLTD